MNEIDRYRGCMLGMAVADAVGTTLEFEQPEADGYVAPEKRLTDMVGGGPFQLEIGQWTDDTSMALCLAASLIEKNGFDPVDQCERYLRWFQEGYMSSTGECFDIGGTTRRALNTFKATWEPYCGPKEPTAAGNGSIMRLAPIPLYYRDAPLNTLMNFAAKSSQTTHGAAVCVDACEYMSRLIVGALKGKTKEELLSPPFHVCATQEIGEVAEGSYRRQPPQIRGEGYVAKTLEAALWAFNETDNFKDGCLKVVNLGLDSDSTAAVYGQIAGAYYGVDGIPQNWLDHVAFRDIIEKMADQLYEKRYKEGAND